MDYNLQEELLSLGEDPSLYPISNELDIPDLSPAAIDTHLSSAIDAIIKEPDSVHYSPEETFDVFASVLKHADAPPVTGPVLQKTLDAILHGLKHHSDAVMLMQAADDLDAPLQHKAQLERWAFLLQWFVAAAERGAGRAPEEQAVAPKKRGKKATPRPQSSLPWVDLLPPVLGTMHRALRVPSSRIWRTSSEREAFISCFTKPAYQLAEVELYLKTNEVRLGIYKVICLAVKFHGHGFGAQTSIMQNLTYYEHLSEPMAELLTILDKEFDYPQLAEEVLREVAAKTFLHNDAKGPRSFQRFLVRFAEMSPRVVHKQMPLLLAHLDNEDLSMSDEGEDEQKQKQIKRFFEILFERYLDLNSYVRSKVLTTLIKLCDLPAKFPKQRAHITELTIRTLADKTSSARRYSIQLLCRLLETHPFGALHGGTLNLLEWQERYEKLCAELDKVDTHEMEKARQDAGMDDEEDEEGGDKEDESGDEGVKKEEDEEAEDDDEAGGASPRPKKNKGNGKPRAKPRPSQINLAAVQAEQAALDPETIMRLRLTKKYYSDALKFINQIEGAIPTLCELLVSTNKSEVLEAMRFFRTAYEYNIESSEQGIKTMLHLIWTKDNNATTDDGTDGRSIRGNLIDVYRSLYFDVVPDLSPKQQVNRITKNMLERTYGATLAELTSLEELMRTMMADGGVHPDVINKLWQVYTTGQEIPKPQRQGAIIILGMLAVAKREVVAERVESLLKIGLDQHGQNDLVLARYTCIALQRLGGSAKKVKGSLTDKTMRLPMDNAIFVRLQHMVERPSRSPQWFAMAEQAINTIYLLGEQPDALGSTIIRNMTAKVAKQAASEAPSPSPEDVEELADPASPSRAGSPKASLTRSNSEGSLHTAATSLGADEVSAYALAQLVFIVGHVALKHIVYLELVEREFKRRKDEKAKEKAAAKAADKDGNDLDAVAGNAEDDIGDLISGIREKELLYGDKSLLAVYGPLIVGICASPKRYKSPTLRQASTLALTKFMCVSAEFCEAHLPLLFQIYKKVRDPVVRSNIVIALGDLAVCWGSLIDDNSEVLYQGLTDPDGVVKKNTLMVLTHLILNGMIKVKGQLGEMAKCLEDPDTRISDLAKLFFTELSTKDNALYNNLQDVISHLSIGAHAVDEATFASTMRFIFRFIEKEKQAEAIIEKLCQRFRLASDERQWRDIAFCLSLLPFKSERSMKKLIEGLPFYADKLAEETVFKRFTEILQKARANKSAGKPETELKEFEAILNEHAAKGLEEQALEADVAKKTRAAKRRAAKRGVVPPKRAPARRGRRPVVSEDEDEED
ncbi:hypothetical protein CspeluHIS016_0108250 [Cutaneotrichosporon spelunceum]|uniref:Condensin complex subunit 1 n=1 Tax=Cutaneotrichosporon spelunceum TaxID=1672016 RepID=A0AAD3TPE1_9TREE|nr:hypothetical protein CspeluHIS016_0108250 [Cutaneotrichosporon spelunceum]